MSCVQAFKKGKAYGLTKRGSFKVICTQHVTLVSAVSVLCGQGQCVRFVKDVSCIEVVSNNWELVLGHSRESGGLFSHRVNSICAYDRGEPAVSYR